MEKKDTSKRIVVLIAGILLLTLIIVTIFVVLDRKIDSEQEEFAMNYSWVYDELKSGDQLNTTYANKEPLYLFASRDLLETGYDFTQCKLGSDSFSAHDSHFNLPSSSGTALFLLAEFDSAVSKDAKLSCKSIPEKGQLAIGFQKEKEK